MAKHFEHRIVAASDWRRCNSQGDGIKGDSNEDRPHFVPLTEQGMTFMKAALFQGGLGLCPGQIKVGEEWIYGFRFITLPDGPDLDRMLNDLDTEVESFCLAIAE